MGRKIFCLSLIFLVCLLLFGCGGDKSPSLLGGITGVAKLQGQSDHSGITVEILQPSKSTTTASDGSYTFSNISATVVTLNFTKSGYANQTKAVNVSAGVTTNVATVTLSSSYGAVAGTVELEGETDHGGISVSISVNGYSSSDTTGSSGSYSFSNLSPGTVTLNFSKSGYDSVTTTNTITAATTTNISTITLSVSIGGISGKATIGGTAASGITVTINGTTTSTQTDSNGNFSFSNLSPGSYTLNYGYTGYISTSNQVTVSAAATVDAGTVNLIYSKGSITGTIDLDGQTDDGGATALVNGTSLTGTSAADGSFIIPDVPTGTYSLTISASGFVTGNTANISVQAGTTTNAGTILLYKSISVNQSYNMSPQLSGDILAMQYFSGSLYISTTERLYRVSIDPPTPVTNSVVVTHNYNSMEIGGGFNQVECFSAIDPSADPTGLLSDYYNQFLTGFTRYLLPQYSLPPAIARYDNTYVICYSISPTSFYKLAPNTGTIAETHGVNETGIVSLAINNAKDTYYACNSTNIYKYNSDFTSVNTLGGGTNFIGITYDETNIWVIDATTKILYKCNDSW